MRKVVAHVCSSEYKRLPDEQQEVEVKESKQVKDVKEGAMSREDDVDLLERCPRSRHASGKYWSDVFKPYKLYEFVNAYVSQSQQKVRAYYSTARWCM